MIVGFTGTRLGMNPFQLEQMSKILKQIEVSGSVHGGCVGADEEFHKIMKRSNYLVDVRPGYSKKNPNDTTYRFDYLDADKIWEPDTHFARNRAIVNQCDLLIGAPPCNEDPGRGGTWYTINYGLSSKTLTMVLKRDEA